MENCIVLWYISRFIFADLSIFFCLYFSRSLYLSDSPSLSLISLFNFLFLCLFLYLSLSLTHYLPVSLSRFLSAYLQILHECMYLDQVNLSGSVRLGSPIDKLQIERQFATEIGYIPKPSENCYCHWHVPISLIIPFSFIDLTISILFSIIIYGSINTLSMVQDLWIVYLLARINK